MARLSTETANMHFKYFIQSASELMGEALKRDRPHLRKPQNTKQKMHG